MTLTLILAAPLPAAAEFETISAAYEISLSNFSVPATPSAGVLLKKCDDCDQFTVRVTPETEYIINDAAVTLEQFREAIFEILDRDVETIVVLHHLETDTVLSVSVTI